jgi:hypothetical protein
MKANVESSCHVIGASAEAMVAFNSDIDAVNLHRPTTMATTSVYRRKVNLKADFESRI